MIIKELESNESVREEEEAEDRMTIAQFTQSRHIKNKACNTTIPKPIAIKYTYYRRRKWKIKSSPTIPNSLVAVDCVEGSKRKRKLIDHDTAKLYATQRAEKFQEQLDPQYPSFVKYMLPSHVYRGFWLGLPSQFCISHLPNHDIMLNLVDEDHKVYLAKYLAEKIGLSGGWRGFAIAHRLVEGDALVFQLTKSTEFQVYILRAYRMAEIGRILRNVNARLKLIELRKREEMRENDGKECRKDLQLAIHKLKGVKSFRSKKARERCRKDTLLLAGFRQPGEKYTRKRPQRDLKLDSLPQAKGEKSIRRENPSKRCQKDLQSPSLQKPEGEKPTSESGDVHTGAMQNIRLLERTVEFKDVKNLDSFSIAANELIIDSEFSEETRRKYYELCCSRSAFLHENLVKGTHCKLAVGAISQTTNIADAIRASNLRTTPDVFAQWESSLEALEQLGMNVGFLRARIKELVSLPLESEENENEYFERHREAIARRNDLNEQIKTSKEKLVELEETSKRFEIEIKTLEVKVNPELKFQAKANAPW